MTTASIQRFRVLVILVLLVAGVALRNAIWAQDSPASAPETAPAGQSPPGEQGNADTGGKINYDSLPRQGNEPRIPGDDFVIARFELKESSVLDAVRLISETCKINVVATTEAGEKIATLFLREVEARQAIEVLTKVTGLWFRVDEETKTIRIMTIDEYAKDLVVYREEETIRYFTLKHPNVFSAAMAIQGLFGPRVIFWPSIINDDMMIPGMMGGMGMGGGMMGGGMMGGMGMGGMGMGGMGMGGFGGMGMGMGMGGMGMGFGGMSGSSQFGMNNMFSRPGGMMGMGGMGMGGMGMGMGMGGMGMGMGMGGMGMGGNNVGNRKARQRQLEDLTTGEVNELSGLVRSGRRISADDIREVTGGQQPIYVTMNQQHNLLIVRTGDSDVMEKIAELVKTVDRPTPQVLLEMKILEVTLDDNFRSIFDINWQPGPSSGGPANGMEANPFVAGAATATQSVLGVGGFAPVEGASLVYQYMNDRIQARVQMLATENRVNVLGTPVILASNNRMARISVAEERPITTNIGTQFSQAANTGTLSGSLATTEVRSVGDNLFIVPKINADRTVTLSITLDSSTVLPGNATIPVVNNVTGGEDGDQTTVQQVAVDTVNSRQLQTPVVAKDGLTIAVGGLIRTTITNAQQKVPGFGDIPYIGRLFRREVRQRTKTELMLLITPRIMTTPEEGQSITNERLESLSRHPYIRHGDKANDRHFGLDSREPKRMWYRNEDIDEEDDKLPTAIDKDRIFLQEDSPEQDASPIIPPRRTNTSKEQPTTNGESSGSETGIDADLATPKKVSQANPALKATGPRREFPGKSLESRKYQSGQDFFRAPSGVQVVPMASAVTRVSDLSP